MSQTPDSPFFANSSSAEPGAERRSRPASHPTDDHATVGGPPQELLGRMPLPASASQWAPGGEDIPIPTQKPEDYDEQDRVIIQELNEHLLNPDCSQIDGYGPQRLSAQIKGVNQLNVGPAFSGDESYLRWIRSMVESSDNSMDWEDYEDEDGGVVSLPDGSRFTFYLTPAAVGHATFSLRKHGAVNWKPEDLIARGVMDARIFDFLQAATIAHVNILFVGTGNSGKTTTMRVLTQEFGDDEKIAVVEQIPELRINKPLVSQYQYRPGDGEGHTLSKNLDRQLYNGVDRLVVGEIHMHGLAEMLEVMMLSEGSMSTYHARTTELAGERMKSSLQREIPNLSARTAVAKIRQAVELVVVMKRINGVRRVVQVSEIDWRVSADDEYLQGRDLFLWDPEAATWRGQAGALDLEGRIVEKLADARIQLPKGMFVEQADIDKLRQAYGG